MINRKATIILSIIGLTKRSFKCLRANMKFELNLSDHATIADIKNATAADTLILEN